MSRWWTFPRALMRTGQNVFDLFVNSLAENGIFPDNLAAFSSLWQGVETGSGTSDIVAQLGIDLGSPNPFEGLMERLRHTPRSTDAAGDGSEVDIDFFREMVTTSDQRVHKRARVDVEPDRSSRRQGGDEEGVIEPPIGVSEAAFYPGFWPIPMPP